MGPRLDHARCAHNHVSKPTKATTLAHKNSWWTRSQASNTCAAGNPKCGLRFVSLPSRGPYSAYYSRFLCSFWSFFASWTPETQTMRQAYGKTGASSFIYHQPSYCPSRNRRHCHPTCQGHCCEVVHVSVCTIVRECVDNGCLHVQRVHTCKHTYTRTHTHTNMHILRTLPHSHTPTYTHPHPNTQM